MFIELDDAHPGFSVIGKLLGPKGAYLRHITNVRPQPFTFFFITLEPRVEWYTHL